MLIGWLATSPFSVMTSDCKAPDSALGLFYYANVPIYAYQQSFFKYAASLPILLLVLLTSLVLVLFMSLVLVLVLLRLVSLMRPCFWCRP